MKHKEISQSSFSARAWPDFRCFIQALVLVAALVGFKSSAEALEYLVQLDGFNGERIEGVVDTSADTFTLRSWAKVFAGTDSWVPNLQAYPLVLHAFKQDGSWYDVPDDWDGTLTDWAFIQSVGEKLENITWTNGSLPYRCAFKNAACGWGGFRSQPSEPIIRSPNAFNKSSFMYFPYGDGSAVGDVPFQRISVQSIDRGPNATLSVRLYGKVPHVILKALPGSDWGVQWTADLASQWWQDLAQVSIGPNGTGELIDRGTTTSDSMRFYRLQLLNYGTR
ncbi:MAG: hypothetical protein U1G07_19740 [Verrucomicrobiota bacterium]